MGWANALPSRVFREGLSTAWSASYPAPGAVSDARRRWSWPGWAPSSSAAGAASSPWRRPPRSPRAAWRLRARALDIREEEAVDGFFDRLLERHGRLDVLVNNAGGQFLAPAESISPKGFRTVIELNVQGTWLMTHAAATKAFIPQGGGKVMSVTLSPHNGMPGMVHSGAARAAVENMMRTLAIEWSRFGIKTCALAMGHFATERGPHQVSEGGGRELRRIDPTGARRAGRGDGLADCLPGLTCRRLFSGTTITIDGARDDWVGPWPLRSITTESGGALAEQRRPKD